MSLQLRNIRFRKVFCLNHRTNDQLFFNDKSALWTSYFFHEIILKVGVRLIHKYGLYTSLYGI